MVKMCESTKEALLKKIEDKTWPALERAGIRYARFICRQNQWQGVWGGIPPGGYDGEDFVAIVVLKTLSEKLKCDKEIKFETFFFRSIRWEILNLVRRAENKRMQVEQHFDRGQKGHSDIFDLVKNIYIYRDQTQLTEIQSADLRQILMGYLDYIENDPELRKVARIFFLHGIVYQECFLGITDDSDGLMMNLVEEGYINQDGEVQDIFWELGNYTKMLLGDKYCNKKKEIFQIIYKSIFLRWPREIAAWLHVDVEVINNIKKRMWRSLLRYLQDLRLTKEDLL